MKFEVRMIHRPPDAERSLVMDYLDSISRPHRGKLIQCIMDLAELGPYQNAERYGTLGDGVYELKFDQHRIPFFYSGRQIVVLTHGFFKRQNETAPMQSRRARELRDLYERKFLR